MKTARISLVGLAFLGLSVSAMAQEECDTLKWKAIKTYYGTIDGSSYHNMGELDGIVINIDTLPVFYLGVDIVNVSNDTFFANESLADAVLLFVYADTGLIGWFGPNALGYIFDEDYFPNDTLSLFLQMGIYLSSMINSIKEVKGIELEEISYWKMIIGVNRTSKDGFYSGSVCSAGADTSIFRVVRGGVGVKELQSYEVTKLQVYPNPAKNQLTIDCRDVINHVSTVEIYDVVGQLMQKAPFNSPEGGKYSPPSEGLGEATIIIDISRLANGMYFLKMGNRVTKFVKE